LALSPSQIDAEELAEELKLLKSKIKMALAQCKVFKEGCKSIEPNSIPEQQYDFAIKILEHLLE